MSACRFCRTTLLNDGELCLECHRWFQQERRLNAYRAGLAASPSITPSRLQRPAFAPPTPGGNEAAA